MAQYKNNEATHVVTTIIFNDLEKAKTGFEMIKDLEAIKEIEMEQMVLAERNETDGFSFIDAIDFTQQDQSFKGSLIGMAIGVVGGPFGMLVGSVAGYLIGANRDEKNERDSFDLFNRTLNQINPDHYGVIIISEVNEDSEAINALAAELGATVRRTGETFTDETV
ncbi:putative membrane protein [Exiguobacterium sp. PvP048]|uniref:hypothetical protein n=1 Tax=unclassified Exiguobacterium TaxID=2644629 RepID=UPI003392E837